MPENNNTQNNDENLLSWTLTFTTGLATGMLICGALLLFFAVMNSKPREDFATAGGFILVGGLIHLILGVIRLLRG